MHDIVRDPKARLDRAEPLAMAAADALSPQALLRHRRLILAVTVLALLAGLAATLVRSPRYTAMARVLVENQALQINQNDVAIAPAPVDAAMVLNQMEVLSADGAVSRVVQKLGLDRENQPGLLSRIMQGIGLASAPDPAQASQDAIRDAQKALAVFRRGGSHVVEVAYTSASPATASAFVSTLLRQVMDDQRDARAFASRLATGSMQERVRGTGVSLRVISEPVAPTRPNGPSALIILAASLVGGLGAGLAAAFARELVNGTVRTAREASNASGAECLGYVENFGHGGAKVASALLWSDPKLASHPTLVNARLSLGLDGSEGRSGLIGVVALDAGDGASTVSLGLARQLALDGRKVLLIDGHRTGSSLTQHVETMLQQGREAFGLRDWLVPDEVPGLVLLVPTEQDGPVALKTLLSKDRLAQAQGRFDTIVVDLPPLSDGRHLREIVRLFGCFLVVCRWSGTNRSALARALAAIIPQQRLVGCIVNRAGWPETGRDGARR